MYKRGLNMPRKQDFHCMLFGLSIATKFFLHKNHCTLSRVSAQPRQLSFPFGNRCAVSIKSGIDMTNFPSSRALFAKAEEFRFLGTCQSSVFFDPCILVFSSLLGRVSAGVSRPWVFFTVVR